MLKNWPAVILWAIAGAASLLGYWLALHNVLGTVFVWK